MRPESWPTRLHLSLRWRLSPLKRLVEEIPVGSHVLDVGCGHGLVSLWAAADRGCSVTGVDHDQHRIEVATHLAARLGVDASFQTQDISWVPPDGTFDVVVVCDALYLLGHAAAEALVERLLARLGPGGRLLVKETDTTPRWKATLGRVQELLAVRLGITRGEVIEHVGIAPVLAAASSRGCRVRTERWDRWSPYAHVFVEVTPVRDA